MSLTKSHVSTLVLLLEAGLYKWHIYTSPNCAARASGSNFVLNVCVLAMLLHLTPLWLEPTCNIWNCYGLKD